MADQEKNAQAEAVAKAEVTATSHVVSLTEPPASGSSKSSNSSVTSKERRSSRNTSPTRLSTELVLKVITQMRRLKMIKNIADQGHSKLAPEQVTALHAQLDGLHKAFQKEHSYFEVTWPEAFLDHDYFERDIYYQEAELFMTAKLSLSQRKHLYSNQLKARSSIEKALEEFLTSRALARERIEATPAHPDSSSQSQATSSKVRSKKVTAHYSSTGSSTKFNAYPCDRCNGAHFIVTCSKFRELSVDQRVAIAVKKRLCCNCLGRHRTHFCKSTQTCKTCQRRHHTMLHGAQQPSTSTSEVQSTY